MEIVCLDLEGVLFPEIWINVAERTGIEKLKMTTRDISDYNVLMQQRLALLTEHNLGLSDIQAVIDTLEPMEGAEAFVNWLRERYQLAILSDTFYEFAAPLMRKLSYPMILCHHLEVDSQGKVTGYQLRQEKSKRQSVRAFKLLNYKVIAAGDSYNDINMLHEADAGILFSPPDNVVAEFPQFPVTRTYEALQDEFTAATERIRNEH
ncbi:bifunctional phosphoserine phosphatase/homoserine phosphotransferase ThrH [Anaerolineales bacterium HSG6]|nr:bifunctional phosphoserine phosphatase/homoserine phosphotransferase ThrH [Anaerolineales bacterium HSG6]MDM8529796.1 bifunctional phosphoserine phosphatase/homoserine phosphotransferase ThrH [Anaerolineales bacterium HSG25]